MNRYFLILFCLAGLKVHASALQVDNLDNGWTAHQIKRGTVEAMFSGDAEMVLNYHEVGDKVLASIFVRDFQIPRNIKLADDVSAWRKVMFPRRGSIGYKVISERTFLIDGHWRYILEYKAATGTTLTSIVMATVIDGKLHTFLYEQPQPLYIRMVASVREMFKKVQLS